jgi:RNA polymerase sigma-54 factor
MKQALHVQLGQQLKMTPQLQQAIRLLQLSTLDLRQEIQEALETNPLLDEEETYSDDVSDNDPDLPANEDQELDGQPDLENNQTLTEDLGVDTDWEDGFSNSPLASGSYEGEGENWEARTSAPVSLQDHLLWQLNLTPITETDRAIAYAVIESLDERGYLNASLAELAQAASNALGDSTPEDGIEEDEVQAVLHLIQHFDPPGIAYKDLR